MENFMIDQKLSGKLLKSINLLLKLIQEKQIVIDLNGHFGSEAEQARFIDRYFSLSGIFGLFLREDDEISTKFISSMSDISDGNIVEPFKLPSDSFDNICWLTGEPVDFWLDNNRIFVKEACSIEFKPIEVLIPVPSGKLVVENNLLQHFSDPDFDVNKFHGIKSTIEVMADQHLFNPFVGNTCPSFKYNDPQEKSGLIFYPENHENDNPDCLGSVITDLWWLSIIDLEIFKKISSISNTDHLMTVDVKPGWYRSRSVYPTLDRFNLDWEKANFIYADMIFEKSISASESSLF